MRRLRLYKNLLKELKERVQSDPNYADLHHQLGLVLFMEGDLEGAERAFIQALKLNPNYREAAIHLGCLLIERRRWDEAQAIFLAESKKNPKEGFLHRLLGMIYLQMGKPQEALLRIQKGLRVDPTFRDECLKRGMLKRGKISLPEGEGMDFGKVHLRRLYGGFFNAIGMFLARKGRRDQALQAFKQAENLVPEAFQFHYNLGSVFYHYGDYRRAIREFKKALKLNPDHGMACAHLSYIYGLRRRMKEALRWMERAVQSNPRYADLHYHLGLLYGDQERYQEAISELKKAIRINPNYLFARINLGDFYEKMERWKEAQREYETVLRITPEDEHVGKRLERLLI